MAAHPCAAGISDSIRGSLKQRLTDRETHKDIGPVDYLFGEFNAWSYEHADNFQAGITQEMMASLTEVPSFVSGWVDGFINRMLYGDMRFAYTADVC